MPYREDVANMISDTLAYDMLPTNVVISGDTEIFALSLNGKKTNLSRNKFLAFADTSGIPAKSVEKMMGKIASMQSMYLSLCRSSNLPKWDSDRRSR